MYNNLLLTLCISIIPMLGIGFVLLLVLHKLYIKVRSQFNIKVNCWFCNEDTKVPYPEANNWTCLYCQQYNGFDKHGDYNKEIIEQIQCTPPSIRFCSPSIGDNFADYAVQSSNGFCNNCNEAQRLKIEKLAKFEPKNEKRFEEEFNNYKNRLESEFSLCTTCDRHLSKVLREKKKMVLGAKFLNLIIKGAETLKQPYLNEMQQFKQNQWKKRCRIWILLLTLIQILCLCSSSLPVISKHHITLVVGENFGNIAFNIVSHIHALLRVSLLYLNALCEHTVISKLMLFLRTIYMMVMYSMGLRNTHLSSALFINIYPFAVLILAFIHNIADCFHLSRYTILMAVWSCFSAGLLDQIDNVPPQILIFIATICTFLCTFMHQTGEPSKLANTTNSFHKMCSDDYFSDEDTISLLSQQFNSSIVSNGSACSNRSFVAAHNTSNASMTFTENFNKFSSNPSPARFDSYKPKSAFVNRNLYNTHASTVNAFRMNNSSSPMHLNFTKPEDHHYNSPMSVTAHLNDKHQSTSLYKPYFGMGCNRLSSTNNADIGNVRPSSRNIILPSRFNSHASWLSGGYFNRPPQSLFPNDLQNKNTSLQETHGMQFEDNLSRSSSQSSGFESQQTPLSTSREDSHVPDVNDIHNRTLKADNVNTFKPINSSILNNLSTEQQLIANQRNASCPWTTSNICQKPISSSIHNLDSFNLRKIDEQLPILDVQQVNTHQELL